jgi:hypothetical protein
MSKRPPVSAYRIFHVRAALVAVVVPQRAVFEHAAVAAA